MVCVGAARRSQVCDPSVVSGLQGSSWATTRAVVLGLVWWSLTVATSSEKGCTNPSWSSFSPSVTWLNKVTVEKIPPGGCPVLCWSGQIRGRITLLRWSGSVDFQISAFGINCITACTRELRQCFLNENVL